MPPEPSQAMTLEQLQRSGVEGRIMGAGTQLVSGVQHDLRRVAGGGLFGAGGASRSISVGVRAPVHRPRGLLPMRSVRRPGFR